MLEEEEEEGAEVDGSVAAEDVVMQDTVADQEQDTDGTSEPSEVTSYETAMSSAHSYLHLEEQRHDDLKDAVLSSRQLKTGQYVLLPVLALRDVVLFPGDQMPFTSSTTIEHKVMKEILGWEEKETLRPRRIIDLLHHRDLLPRGTHVVRHVSHCFGLLCHQSQNPVGTLANVYSSGLAQSSTQNVGDGEDDNVNTDDNSAGAQQVNVIVRASHLLFRLVLALHIGGRFIFACVQILPNHPYVQRPLQTKNVTRLPEFAWKMFDSKVKLKKIYSLLKKKGMEEIYHSMIRRKGEEDDEDVGGNSSIERNKDGPVLNMSVENAVWWLSSNLPLPTKDKIDLLTSPSCFRRLGIIEKFLFNLQIDRLVCLNCNRSQAIDERVVNI